MPRTGKGGRGGPRQGAPGKAYTNRSDMTQAPRAVPGQTYGQAGAQLASQQSVPLPAGAPAGGGGAPSAVQGQSPAPPLTPINAPTQRPGEPLTTGIASGPGLGPEALGMAPAPEDPTIHILKGILSRYPNPAIAALLAQAQSA